MKTLIINANLFGHFYFRETKGHDAYYIILELKILGDENDYLYIWHEICCLKSKTLACAIALHHTRWMSFWISTSHITFMPTCMNVEWYMHVMLPCNTQFDVQNSALKVFFLNTLPSKLLIYLFFEKLIAFAIGQKLATN